MDRGTRGVNFRENGLPGLPAVPPVGAAGGIESVLPDRRMVVKPSLSTGFYAVVLVLFTVGVETNGEGLKPPRMGHFGGGVSSVADFMTPTTLSKERFVTSEEELGVRAKHSNPLLFGSMGPGT
ncbi:hypothetical protein BJY52DRAFT_1229985 [Lactarius psammicola]|nr:hypothetical protein BJY52DRAFT_1229985 [Lactarius psammicola]